MTTISSSDWSALGLDPPTCAADWDDVRLRAIFEDAFGEYLADVEMLMPETSVRRYGSVMSSQVPRPTLTQRYDQEDGRCIITTSLRVHKSAEFDFSLPVTLCILPDGSLDPAEPVRLGLARQEFPDHHQELVHRLLTRLSCAGASSIEIQLPAHWLHEMPIPPAPEQTLRDMEMAQMKQRFFRRDAAVSPDGSKVSEWGEQLLSIWRQLEVDGELRHIDYMRQAIRQMGLPQDLQMRLISILNNSSFTVRADIGDLVQQMDEIRAHDEYAAREPLAKPACPQWELEDQIIDGWSIEQIKRVWEDEWTDGAGRLWQVRVRPHGKYSAISWHHYYQNSAKARVNGYIYCDGQYAGSFARGAELSPAGKFGLTVKHEELTLEPDFTGKGFGREWTRRCVTRYKALGADEVTLSTANEGAVVWPRLGFAPTYDYDSQIDVPEQIEVLLHNWKRSCQCHSVGAPNFTDWFAELAELREEGDGTELIEFFEEIYAAACAWAKEVPGMNHPFSGEALTMAAEMDRLISYLDIDEQMIMKAESEIRENTLGAVLEDLDTLPLPPTPELPEITAQPSAALDA